MKIKRSFQTALFLLLISMLLAVGTPVFAASNPESFVFDISEGDIGVAADSDNKIKVTYGDSQTTTAGFANTQKITIIGSSEDHKVSVNIASNTANITLDGVNISLTTGDQCAFSIDSGTVNLTLKGTNRLKSTGGNPGLRAAEGNTLTIQGTGSLEAIGAANAAGIGGGNSVSGGTLTINSGTVKATGGTYGAGIGGGFSGSTGTIRVYGGTVIATGGVYGSGIGSGLFGSDGKILISDDAEVVAVSDGYKSAIQTTGGVLEEGSTAYVLMANFTNQKSSGTTTDIYLKSDDSLKSSCTPGIDYKSIAFTVPGAETYLVKTEDILQKYGNDKKTNFTIIDVGITEFNSVVDAIIYHITVNKDNEVWESGTPELKLSSSSVDLTDAVSGTCIDGIYSFTDMNPDQTYYIWDTDADCYTGKSVGSTSTDATVDYYTVTLTANHGIEETSGAGAYLSGDDIAIDATATDGYYWYKWTDTGNGSLVSRTKEYTITDISEPKSYTANAEGNRATGIAWTDPGNYDIALYEVLTDPAFADTVVDISTPRQLAALARAQDVDGVDFSGVTFELIGDIDLSGYLWDPIGIGQDDMLFGVADGESHPFTGNFDGNGHVIRNMTVDGHYIDAGLFGIINDPNMDNLDSGNAPVLIRNVTVEGTVEVTDGEVAGGIVGLGQNLILTNCVNRATITATGDIAVVGGIVGFGLLIALNHCINESGADIFATATSNQVDEMTEIAGGVVGCAFLGSIYNCANRASVTMSAADGQPVAGGVFGFALSGTALNCYNTGAVTAEGDNSSAGGICGIDLNAIGVETPCIQNAYNIGAVTATRSAAIAASVNAIDHCYYLTGTAQYAYFDEEGNPVSGIGMSSAEMQADDFLQTLNGWVGVNSILSTYVEENFDFPATDTIGWKHNRTVNSGYPIFITDAEDDHTVITVDGTEYAIGTEKADVSSTTATVDQDQFTEAIATAAENSVVIFPISANTAVTAELTLKNIEDMAKKGMVLAVRTGGVTYSLETAAIDTANIISALGTTDTENIPFCVRIADSDAKANDVNCVISPIDFTIICTYNGKTVHIDAFDRFVSRSVEITKEQASEISTAVVINPDGSLRSVPTKITVDGNRYFAVFSSMTNSTYTFIQNPVSFSDVEDSWAKDIINDMGARVIVQGVGNDKYNPKTVVTRAEFVAVLVRGLGLEKGADTGRYSDVASTDWYAGYLETASAYGLIKGFDDGTFGANEKITREQAMVIISRAMKLTKLSPDLTDDQMTALLVKYEDKDDVSAWSRQGIAACLYSEIIFGRTSTQLCPESSLNRAEAAVMVQRLLHTSGLI